MSIFSFFSRVKNDLAAQNRTTEKMSVVVSEPADKSVPMEASIGAKQFSLQAATTGNGMGQWGGSRDDYANQEYADKLPNVQRRAQDLHFNCADIRGHHFGRTGRIVGKGVHYKSIIKGSEVGLSDEAVADVNAQLNRVRRLHSRAGGFDAQDKGRSEGILQVQALMTSMVLGGCLIHRVIRKEAGRVLPLALELIPGSRISQPLNLAGDPLVHLGIRYSDTYRSRVLGWYVARVPKTIGNSSIPLPDWDYIAWEDGIFLEPVEIAGLDRSLPDVVAVTRLVFNRSELVDAAVESARNHSRMSVIFEVPAGLNPADAAEDAVNSTAGAVGDTLPESWRMVNGVMERYVANGTKTTMNSANLPSPDFKGFNDVTDSRLTRGLNTRGSEFTRKVDASYSGGMQERQIDNPNVELARHNFKNSWNRVHEWVLDACFISGAVEMSGYSAATRVYWSEARVQFPGEVPLNPVDWISSQTKRVASGLSSLSHECEENGDDYEDIIEQQANDYRLRRKYETNGVPVFALEPLQDMPAERLRGNPPDAEHQEAGAGADSEGGIGFSDKRPRSRVSQRLKAARFHAEGKRTQKMYANLAGSQVDLEKRQIIGFAVATIGPALGKGESIDQQTLEQIRDLGNRGPIRCRFNHPGGDSISSDLHDLIGQATNFRIVNDKVIADFKAVSVDANPKGMNLLHFAKDTPEIFGASMVFEGQAQNGKTRVETLFAVDFVDIPAANANGLFSGAQTMSKATIKHDAEKKMFYVEIEGKRFEVEPEEKKPETAKMSKMEDGTLMCPGCGAKYAGFPGAETQKNSAETTDPAAVAKDLHKNTTTTVSDGAVKTFSAADIEEARLDGQKKAQTFTSEFDAVMDAAGFKGDDRDTFRKNYLVKGQQFGIGYVKDIAQEKMAARTTAVGSGGVQGDKTDDIKTECAKRFGAEAWVRASFGCNTADETKDEYKKGLERYIASRVRCESKTQKMTA